MRACPTGRFPLVGRSPCRTGLSCSSAGCEPVPVSQLRVTQFRCTYRLQLNEDFGFRAAREIALPYVRELGVSHLYLSPSLQARKGSTHGYDVVDPTRISDD